jgi:hypothetical protein
MFRGSIENSVLHQCGHVLGETGTHGNAAQFLLIQQEIPQHFTLSSDILLTQQNLNSKNLLQESNFRCVIFSYKANKH